MQEVLPGEAPEPARGQEEDALPRLRLSRRPPLPFSLALATSLGSGLLLSLAFPPAELWPLGLIALAPFLWGLRRSGPARAFALGLAWGVGFYGATLYWILRFGTMAWVSLTLLSALSSALFGLFAVAVMREGHPVRNALGLAGLWVVIDWLRGLWPLGGFTWGALGISQVDDRALLPLATVAGVWGVTFVAVACNALLLEAIAGGGGGRRRAARAALAGALVLSPAAIPFAEADGPPLEVSALQVDVRRAEDSSTAVEDLRVADLHVELHRGLAGDPPDLALWGEGALDPAAAADPETIARVMGVVAEVGVPTLIGAVLNDPDGRQRTSALLLDQRGRAADRYDKTHLVPFGEYVPFRDELGWVSAIRQIPVDRAPGASIHTVSTGALPPFGTPICFENGFPQLPRAFVRAGATFLVVPVNNASYGFTAASDQHLQMSRMRAVETGRWIVDAAVSGVTAYIDPHGRVVRHTELFQTAILSETIRSSEVQTPYVRLGDWLPWLCLLTTVALTSIPRRRTAARPTPGSLVASPRTLVILPTYKEAETVERVLRGVLEVSPDIDALVVDDSSPDGTAEVVRAVMATEPRVRLIERPRKAGLASAYLEGFALALRDGYDLAVEMDSDLSHDPADLPRLLAAAQAHDLTVGCRYMPGGSVTNWSRLRVALSKGGNSYAKLMLGLPVRDATSGYRVYRRQLLAELTEYPVLADGYGFQIELVMRAERLGYQLGEVPISFREREHGHSKISRRIVVEALWLVTKWGLALRFGRRSVDRVRVSA